jgi:hypothetical protein
MFFLGGESVQMDTDLSPMKRQSGCRERAPKTINWNEWNPFERATGKALKQLNKRQPKKHEEPDAEDALI